MSSIFGKLEEFFSTTLWEAGAAPSGKLKKILVTTLRLLYKIGQDFLNGEIPRRASSLVYTTLLTLVPILAVAFSVLKSLGVHNMLEPFMRDFLAPLGQKGDEITFTIIGYVERMNVGLLGAIGLATLFYTVMNTIQQVENAFNHFWQIREQRSLLRRFRDYMGVILVGPVLIVSALGITTSIMSNSVTQKILSLEPFGTVLFLLGKFLPYILISLSFTLMYYLLPNTGVSVKSAFVGGLSAGVLWQAGSWAFARFIVSSAQYSAVYSGFAIVLLFMIWLYYSWLILLTGVKVSFYHQFPVLLGMQNDRILCSGRYTRRLAILLMYLIGYNYFYGKPLWTLPSLIERLRIPKSAVQDVLEALENGKLILRVVSDNTFVPARDIETITLREIVHNAGGEVRGVPSFHENFIGIPGVEDILSEAEDAADDILSRQTVRGLVVSRGHEVSG